MSKIDMGTLEKILSHVSFYVDKHDHEVVYAEYTKEDDVRHFQNIESNDFKSCLRIWYRNEQGNDEDINVSNILSRIHDDANYYEEYPEVEPYNRIAGNLHKGIEYFLADKERRIVSITDGQWEVTNVSSHKFLTSVSYQPQVQPVRNSAQIRDLLQPFVNLKGDSLTLFIIWLIQGFSCGSHYGVMLSAERGSGKSTLTRVINRLLAPSAAETAIMPKSLDDMQVCLANNYLACFDNVRTIPIDHSDTLCSAITGGTVVKRTLYKTSEASYLHLHNVVVINGIDVFPQESDLAERFLMFQLKKLTPKETETDFNLWRAFEEKRPLILGCIFDILAEAMVRMKQIRTTEKLRMAEAYLEMVVIADVMGISEKRFYEIIQSNIKEMHRACAASPLTEAICEYMDGPWHGKRKYAGTATDVFTRVRNNYSGSRNMLPGTAATFSKRLKAEHDALSAAGFSSIVDDTGSRGSTITIIRDK